jgi:hypothetical protein
MKRKPASMWSLETLGRERLSKYFFMRPVPDRLATQLGANLIYTRLKGRGSLAMAKPVAGDWLEDTAEALASGGVSGTR